jgi:hypothetical protein
MKYKNINLVLRRGKAFIVISYRIATICDNIMVKVIKVKQKRIRLRIFALLALHLI